MQFDPVGSDQPSPSDIREFTERDPEHDEMLPRQARDLTDEPSAPARGLNGIDIDDDNDEDDEEPLAAPRALREGLPARFRMRHTPHYVDELLGGAPLRTVREIPIAEIESPHDDRSEIEHLERSIRRLGVLEPLVVGRRGGTYRVIAGMRRLRAAHHLGLATVPCLVHDHELDEDGFDDMRDATTQRLAIPLAAREPEDAAPVEPVVPAEPTPDRLRWGVLADLAAVELARTNQIAAAQQMLQSVSPIQRASTDPRSLVAEVVLATATEARLRGVRVESAPLEDVRDIFLDPAQCCTALTGLVQCLLALAPRGGAVLRLHAQMTTIRPALIVECAIDDSDPAVGAELGPELDPHKFAKLRFFEAEWHEHPCGSHGAQLLAALAHAARAHGGRVDVKPTGKGCAVRFIVPRLDG